MTRYRLALSIRYQFARPLAGPARELLRICPAHLPGAQEVADCTVTVRPAPLERVEFTDFFGTRAIALVLPAGAESFAFDMTAEVLRHDPGALLDLSGPLAALPAELASETGLGPHSPHHFLPPSPRIPRVPEIARFATDATRRAATVHDAVKALGQAVHRAMRFDAGATTVDTPVAQAFAGRHGVCQDFSQVMIAGLRSLGVPAAYVSGFLRTRPPPGQPRLAGADAMHAWVRAWCGARAGWVDYDPTNACFAGVDHVTVGHGRDYADAAPVIGALRLEGTQSGEHSVDLEAV
jgi:transglutaminase-like putative cysteine protease